MKKHAVLLITFLHYNKRHKKIVKFLKKIAFGYLDSQVLRDLWLEGKNVYFSQRVDPDGYNYVEKNDVLCLVLWLLISL